MLVPLSWLRDFATFDLDANALAEVFDDLGMVVEGIRRVGEGLDAVVVGRVAEIHPIDGADKIRRVLVEAGGPEPVQVVCGAWNFDVGDYVPLAPVGAVLSGNFAITRRRMKGVVSDGMLCSPIELGLGDDAAGILVLPDAALAGMPLTKALGIDVDVVYDLAIEANRPDAMSVAGVARDAAARLGSAFAVPVPAPAGGVAVDDRVPPVTVDVQDPDLCPRFTALVLEDVIVTESPAWLARRLTLAGMRPINSVVDASNYVMLELGQPTHPYDLDQLGGGGFVVRAAGPGESVTTLDGVVRTLGGAAHPDCVICDATDVAVGVAGIMGGAASEISAKTTRVVLEAANFAPMAVARTARRLSLRTDASARFERGVDVEGIERAVDRFCELLALTSPGLRVVGGMVDVRAPGVGTPLLVPVRTDRVNAILGTELADEDIRRYLAPIGFDASSVRHGLHQVTVPTFRPDVTGEIDVIEEVARHHGYANIHRTVPTTAQVGRLNPYQLDRRRVRGVLAGAGLSESMCSQLLGPGDHARSGLPEDAIAAVDPLAREESVLRTSLLPGMLRAVAFNLDRRIAEVGLFEIGHTFQRPREPLPELPDEREMLGLVVAGAGVPGLGAGVPAVVTLVRRLAGALRLEGVELVASTHPGMHPGRTAEVWAGPTAMGYLGEVDPAVSAAWGIEGRVGWAEVDLETLLGRPRRSESVRPVTRFPSTDIDLAFIVRDDVPAAAVEATLAREAGELLEWVALFDVYRGPGVPPGHRSLAYRLRFSALDRTLTDAEVGERRQACITAVRLEHGAELRG
jgi:phenylalanyl-tRNA synthetase beta chain